MNEILKTNRIDSLFESVQGGILSVYFTAGYPNLDDTLTIIKNLENAGADLVEIGIPFSDPIADGPTIQQSNQVALDNGMHLSLLLDQLSDIRAEIKSPLILMGYLNPLLQFGIKKLCAKCHEIGIDGFIIPDLPIDEYLNQYQSIFESFGLFNIFLISPHTSQERILRIDQNTKGFIYMVAAASTTGVRDTVSEDQIAYFARIQAMKLNNPTLIGFGISNKAGFDQACLYASGVIIGSAFIEILSRSKNLEIDIQQFIDSIKGNKH